MASGIRYNYEEVKVIVENKGYILLSKEYINARTKVHIEDNQGYQFSITLGHLINGKTPLIANINNPYTIQNIKHYLILNKSKTILLSEKYTNCKQLLKFKCECENIYECSLDKLWNRNKAKCNKCNIDKRGYEHRIPLEDVKNTFIENNLIPLFDDYNSCNEKLLCKDEYGYIGLISFHHLK
jgi:hypothetical protein